MHLDPPLLVNVVGYAGDMSSLQLLQYIQYYIPVFLNDVFT